jgi:hypothetical protein
MQVVMAAGTGKSTVIGHTFARMLKSGRARRPLYLTPLNVLADQMVERLRDLDLGDEGLLGESHYVRRLGTASDQDERGGVVTVATSGTLRSLARSEPIPDFDLIVLDDFRTNIPWHGTSTARLVDRFHATVIAFSSLPASITGFPGITVFTYDLRAALAEGVLVDTSRPESAGRGNAWRTIDTQYSVDRQGRIFLGGVDEDRSAIEQLAEQLRTAGMPVADTRRATPSEAGPGDVFVAIVSPNSVQTPLVDDDFSQSLERRDVDVVPAVIEYCAVPAQLAGRLPVDITAGIDGLLHRLRASAILDLHALDSARFERLVIDLLSRLGFTVSHSAGADAGIDFIGTFQDANRFGVATPYLIQVKLARSSYRDADRLVDLVRDAGPPWRGMVATNGQLTSVTAKRLTKARNEGAEVQVVDGPRLRSLLLRHPDLIVDHFARR